MKLSKEAGACPMNEQEKQALIEYCEAVIFAHVQYGGDSDEEAVYRIALAAMTAEPIYQLINDGNWYDAEKHIYDEAVERGDVARIVFRSATPAVNLAELVPSGWKLLPVELTAEMAHAAREAHEESSYLPYSIYRSMLAAAPEPPSC